MVIPVKQEATSQGHCFSFLNGLHEKRPFSPAAAQYATCDPHNKAKRTTLCAYCFYTHHMSRYTQCHQCIVGKSTSSMGAVLLHNVWDASFLSCCTNFQPPQSLTMKKWSVTLLRWHTESHWNTRYELCLYVIKSSKFYIKSCPEYIYHLSTHQCVFTYLYPRSTSREKLALMLLGWIRTLESFYEPSGSYNPIRSENKVFCWQHLSYLCGIL